MMDNKFRVASTVSDIKDKIRINIDEDADTIYWYIKFNLRLDKSSVTNDTCEVIDTDGYLMRTYIAYDPERDYIVVSPIDTYKNNMYYILTITEQVKSEGGNNLKRPVHILFKLLNNRVSRHEILKQRLKLPETKVRPSNYENLSTTFSTDMSNSSGSLDEHDAFDSRGGKDLGRIDVSINPAIAIIGALLVNVGFFANIPVLFFIALVIFILGFTFVFYQVVSKRTYIYYNMGSHYFKKRNYGKAELYLKRSFAADEMNERAEYALIKVRQYIERAEEEEK